ncbi:MAG TPA: universal stress protein [Ornithinimicrobium sp.]|nr:universal stress protein [Ornithinimicrobium sp.]
MSYSTILVPVAPGHGDEAGRAMEVARSLLSPDGSITVVSVLEELPRYLTAEVYALEPVVEESQEAIAEDLVAEFSAPDVQVVTRRGHATRTILAMAKEGGHDCIVIASAQPGWEHFLLGSTAAGVVRHAHCSVHVVRTQDTTPTS